MADTTYDVPATPAQPAIAWQSPVRGQIRIGSEEHRQMFCRMLLDTYDPYKPAVIAWPPLEKDALDRLVGLPFWDVAVETEGNASLRMQTQADETADPLVREAVALNAFEENRHKLVLEHMVRFYAIQLGPEPEYLRPRDAEWAFLRTGYGECFDSFFAFGLFQLAKESGFFPEALVEVFEPIIQEEARHILFFVNWVAYTRARLPLWRRPWFVGRCLAALMVQAWKRAKLARRTENANFTVTSAKRFTVAVTPRGMIDLCLAENDRRLGLYDSRLLRPKLVPRLVRLIRPFLPRG